MFFWNNLENMLNRGAGRSYDLIFELKTKQLTDDEEDEGSCLVGLVVNGGNSPSNRFYHFIVPLFYSLIKVPGCFQNLIR